jgi:hypothetical protein
MASYRFAVLTEQGESGIKSAEFEALFAPDFVFNAPYIIKPLQNKKLALQFLHELFERSGYPRYTHEFTDDHNTTLLLWEGTLTGPDGRTFTLEGSLALTEREDGLIHSVISYLRPLQVGALIMKPMVASAAAVLPEEYWKTNKPLNLTPPTSAAAPN